MQKQISVKDMTLKQKIGQLIIPGFHSYEYDDQLKTLIEEYNVGNIILFTRNLDNPNQIKKLCRDIHEKCIQNNGVIPFIAIDQEGGLVTRLQSGVTFAPGAMTCAASSVENASFAAGKMIGRDMIKLGMNFDLAPVVDINNNLENPVINVRSYSDDPEVVSTYASKFVAGLATYGVIGCAKHFPGHGDTCVDSHLALASVNYDYEYLKHNELVPYINNKNIASIMSAHIMFPKLDDLPATLSSKILKGILRKDIGYEGIIVSDCLEMKAIQDNYGTPEGAVKALIAGVDMVCICHTLDLQVKAIKLIEKAIEDGDLSIEELDEKVERILKYKYMTYPYLEKYFYNELDYYIDDMANSLSSQIVDGSLTLVKGNIPTLSKDTLIVAPKAVARTIIEDEFDDRNLSSVLRKEFNLDYVYEYSDDLSRQAELLDKVASFKNVIIFSYNAYVNKAQSDFINNVLNINSNAFIFSLKGPMDYRFYNNLNNYMCLYEYTPNSIKTVCNLFKGKITPTGKLPLKVNK